MLLNEIGAITVMVTWCHYTVQKLCKYVLWWLEYSGMVRVITHKCTVWWWWLDCYVAANHWAQSVTLGKRIWLLGVITKSVVRKPNIATHAKSVVFYIVLQHCITTCFVISHHSKPTNRFTSFVILSTQEWTSMTLNSLDVQSWPEMSCYHIHPEPPLNYWTLNWPFTKVYPGQYWLQSFSIKILSQGNNGPIPQYPQLLLLLNSVGLSRITTSSRATEILDLGKAGVHCAIHLSRGERIREGPRDLQVLVRNCRWWCWTGWQKTKIKTRPTLPNTKDYDSYIPLDSKHFDIFMKHL